MKESWTVHYPRHYPEVSFAVFNSLSPIENFHAFLSSADFFPKILLGIPSECETDWVQIRPDILSGLIWVQNICKSYQQTTLGGKCSQIKCMLSGLEFTKSLTRVLHQKQSDLGLLCLSSLFWQPARVQNFKTPKMYVIRAGIHKKLDQTASSEAV